MKRVYLSIAICICICFLVACTHTQEDKTQDFLMNESLSTMLDGSFQERIQSYIDSTVLQDDLSQTTSDELIASVSDYRVTLKKYSPDSIAKGVFESASSYLDGIERIIDRCESIHSISTFLNRYDLLEQYKVLLEQSIETTNDSLQKMQSSLIESGSLIDQIPDLTFPRSKEMNTYQQDLATLIAADNKGTHHLKSEHPIPIENPEGNGTFFLLQIDQILNQKHILAWLVVDGTVFQLNQNSGVGMNTVWPSDERYEAVWQSTGLPDTIRITTNSIFEASIYIQSL